MWLSLLFGPYLEDPRQRRVRRINYAVVAATIFFMYYGMYADFLASDLWSDVGLAIALIVSGLVGWLALHSYWIGLLKFLKPPTRAMSAFRCVVLVPTLVFGYWLAVVHGMGAGITHLLGRSLVTTEAVVSKGRGGRNECDYQVTAPELERAFPYYICISEWRYNRLKDGTRILFEGYRSPLGFSVQNLRFPE